MNYGQSKVKLYRRDRRDDRKPLANYIARLLQDVHALNYIDPVHLYTCLNYVT